MPRVHFVKSARPAKNPSVISRREAAGIEVGDSYYWWTFFKAPPTFSKTRPRASQLTRSKWSTVYSAQEAIEDVTDASGLQAALESAVDDLGTVRDEYNESADAIEENFEGSLTAEACREKADHLDTLISELEDKTSEVEELVECQTCSGEGTVECTDCPDADAFENVHQELQGLDWAMPC
jgi:hypothetical protein